MLITSCAINGTSVLSSLQVKSTRIHYGSLGDVSTASLEFIGQVSTFGTVIVAGQDITIGTGSGTIFTGTVASVDTKAITVSGGNTKFTVQAIGAESSLVDTILTSDVVYSSTNDSTIIAAVFASYLPSISTTHVSTVSSISITARAGWTIRQFLDEVISRSAAIYYIKNGNELWFHADTGVAAPFNIKESQSVGVGEIAPLWQNFSHQTSWANRANRVTVLGQASTGGVRITATVNDASSQATYGIISRNVVDANITSTGEATARGNVELANFANPQVSGRFETRTDGFAPGQSITITMPSEAISTACFIRSVEWTWETPTLTKYSCEYGQFGANLVRRLQRALQDLKPQPYVTVGIPAPAVIAPTHFASTIEPVGLVTATPNGSEELAITKTQNVVYNTYDKKTYRWDTSTGTYRRRMGAGDLEADSVTAGTVATGAIRAVDAAFDTAAIQTADIANAAITTAKIANLAVTDALIANATITGAKIANATITNALIVDATITSAKIASLNADKINAGTISVGSGGLTVSGSGGISIVSSGVTFSVTASGGINGTDASLANVTASASVYVGSIGGALRRGTGFSYSELINSSSAFVGSGGVNTSGSIDTSDVYKMDGTTIIDASKNASFANVDASGSYKMDGTDIIDTSKNASFVNIDASGVYKMDGTTIIDSSGAFIGAGVASTTNGIGGTGHATYQSGWYYGETGPTTFTTTDGKTVTVRGGIITLIV